MVELAPPRAVRNVCFVGAGYVGGPTAAVLALHNRAVRFTVVDRDEDKIGRWNSQHPPIYEPGLQEILRLTRDGGRAFEFSSVSADSPGPCLVPSHEVVSRVGNLFFSTDVERAVCDADAIFICVNTPTKRDGPGAGYATEMEAFDAAIDYVLKHAKPGAIIVDKSTVPVRTANMIDHRIWRTHRHMIFKVLSSPEFLAAGTAVNDLLYPARVVLGSGAGLESKKAARAIARLYNWVPEDKLIFSDNTSAELTKLMANAFLAQRVTSINTVAAICDETEADVDEVAKAIGADKRIGPHYLRAGLGFGGSCFKKDLLSLIFLANTLKLGFIAEYWQAVIKFNEYCRVRLVDRLVARLGEDLAGKTITIIGYAFKSHTNDTRDSPAHDLIKALFSSNAHEVVIYDTYCPVAQTEAEIEQIYGPGIFTSERKPDSCAIRVASCPQEACEGANAVVITTEFQEFVYDSADTIRIRKVSLADPRPFKGGSPTEAEVLALHYFLRQSLPIGSAHMNEDPLRMFNPMPSCKADCPDCKAENNKLKNKGENKADTAPVLNWADARKTMKEPRLVFDGRGVLNVARMHDLGFQVETVGRQRKPVDRDETIVAAGSMVAPPVETPQVTTIVGMGRHVVGP